MRQSLPNQAGPFRASPCLTVPCHDCHSAPPAPALDHRTHPRLPLYTASLRNDPVLASPGPSTQPTLRLPSFLAISGLTHPDPAIPCHAAPGVALPLLPRLFIPVHHAPGPMHQTPPQLPHPAAPSLTGKPLPERDCLPPHTVPHTDIPNRTSPAPPLRSCPNQTRPCQGSILPPRHRPPGECDAR